MSRLCARGGFEIRSLEWTHGRLTRFSIKSTLGGICRLRTFQKLNGLGKFELRPAEGENPNPFFVTFKEAAPIISPQAKLNPPGVPALHLYDIKTVPGDEHAFEAIDE